MAVRWLNKWHASRQYQLDDPTRFYGFNHAQQEIARAEHDIQQCISIINSHHAIIHRSFGGVHDQDTLNYLHHIFERYHGLLDQQHNEYWLSAPESVRRALAQLNVAVHRCERVSRGPKPSMVCTWYGLPKTDRLPLTEMQQWGELLPTFGTLCFCYVEIGKTLEDLAQDNDNYIADQAFRPFEFYSSDFTVRFCDPDPVAMQARMDQMQQYHAQHITWFRDRGLGDFYDARLLPLRFPVADLIIEHEPTHLIDMIRSRQYVKDLYLE